MDVSTTTPKTARIVNTRVADENNVVHTVVGGGEAYRKQPCAECPWRRENAGSFPAEAFRHSANTAFDMATKTFACHMSGAEKPAVCAGFLLRNATHNLSVRLGLSRGLFVGVKPAGAKLFNSYREMAVANGVDPSDPALARCRADFE
jgi:hypothetical protein